MKFVPCLTLVSRQAKKFESIVNNVWIPDPIDSLTNPKNTDPVHMRQENQGDADVGRIRRLELMKKTLLQAKEIVVPSAVVEVT